MMPSSVVTFTMTASRFTMRPIPTVLLRSGGILTEMGKSSTSAMRIAVPSGMLAGGWRELLLGLLEPAQPVADPRPCQAEQGEQEQHDADRPLEEHQGRAHRDDQRLPQRIFGALSQHQCDHQRR